MANWFAIVESLIGYDDFLENNELIVEKKNRFLFCFIASFLINTFYFLRIRGDSIT